MKLHALRSTLALALILTIAVPVLAIVNGTEDTEDTFPNVCSLVFTKQPEGIPPLPLPVSLSSGTLIHPRVVLTAGHSVTFMQQLMDENGLELSDFAVVFDPDVYDGGATQYEIERLIVHPKFAGGDVITGERVDVGLVILKEPRNDLPLVTFVGEGFLDSLDLKGGPGAAEFTVVGYGASALPETTRPGYTIPDGVRRFGTADFRALQKTYMFLSQVFVLDESGTATGDSGGPAFWEQDGTLVQAGIMSEGDDARVSLSVFTRVDRADVLAFIAEAIADVSDE